MTARTESSHTESSHAERAPWRAAPHQADIHLADTLAERPELHVVVCAYHLEGEWDAEVLHTRLRTAVRRHPALGCRLVEDEEGLLFAPTGEPPRWRTQDVPAPASAQDIARLIRAEALRPLDQDRGPLVRGALLRRPDGTADLVLTASHLAVDDHAMDLLAREVLTGEAGTAVGDYPAWAEREALEARGAAERAAHRRDELAAPTPVGEPTWGFGDGDGVGDSAAGEVDGGQIEFTLEAPLWQRVTALAKSTGVTRHSLLTAAAALVWARNGAGDAALVGAFVSRRPARERDTVGYFSSTVPVGVRVDEDAVVTDFLRATQRAAFVAYRNADLALSDVLPRRDGAPGRSALHLAVAQSWQPPTLHLPGLTAVAHPYPDLGVAKFPVLCYLDLEGASEAKGLLHYRRRRFSEAAAHLFVRQLRAVLQDFTKDPHAQLHTVSTLVAEDRERVMAAARGGELAAEALSVPELLRRRAAEAPHRTAVVDAATALSYAELDARSDHLAQVLVERGVLPGDRVGVRMERSAAQVVALTAVLKASGVYVPLDPRYPEARLAHMVQDAGIRFVVGDTDLPPDGTQPPEHWIPAHAVPGVPSAPLPYVGPDDPAYVIYTSGSTGRPKGVLVAHRNVVALLAATRDEFGLGPTDVWSYFHSYAFDFSVWEIWGCLLTGGRLVVVPHEVSRNPEEFHRLLLDEEVTVLSQTPTAFGLLLATEAMAEDTGRGAAPEAAPATAPAPALEPRADLAVRLLVFGGEPLDPQVLLPWFDRYPKARVENMYGITETTVHCTTHPLTREDALAGGRSVGRPLPGWELYVLDPRGRPVAPGVPGEIHVGGAGVALGYLNLPELTEQRFGPSGHPAGPEGRLYRSGDLGRYRPDGTLEHLGRLDAQVKIRGFRIEPGEVRAVLLEDPAVASAAVVVGQPGTPDARLDAYVVAVPGGRTAGLLERAAARLPEHMVPQTLTFLAALPVTANGKLDTAALPPPSPSHAPAAVRTGDEGTGVGAGAGAAAGDTEAVLGRVLAVWQQVLQTPVDAADNFFALGGTSLLALRLKSALRGAGLPTLTLREIVRHATPAAMAALIESRTAHKDAR